MFAGCQKPELESPFCNDLSFVASVEAFSSQTKTAMNSDRQLTWTADDRVAIFQGSTIADEYAIDESCAGKVNAVFNLVDDNSPVNGNFSVGSDLPRNIAFYPYAEDLSLKGAAMEEGSSYEIKGYSLPSVQHYAAKSFGIEAFPMVAVTKTMTNHELQFKNVLGAIKLQLKGTRKVKYIKVEGANGERLSGAATVTAYANNLTPAVIMTGTDEASKSVTLDCGDGVQLNTASATDFIIALPPVLFSKGFTVTVTDVEEKEYTTSATIANTVLRSSILVMPEVLIGSDEEDSGEGDSSSLIDYIDEYSVNHGKGVRIGETVWAPVNCGYHATDYQWGKLYQWGRKYGQGYDGAFYNVSGEFLGAISDATTPEIFEGPVSLQYGRSADNKNVLFVCPDSPGDWLYPQDGTLWNSGTEESPKKTEYDPCPEGWRVPTYAELCELTPNGSSWTTNDLGQPGYWFSGASPYTESAAKVFFPAAGGRQYYDGTAMYRGYEGVYFSSSPYDMYSIHVDFVSGGGNYYANPRACGFSVRCVQNTSGEPAQDDLDEDLLIPVLGVTLNSTSLKLYEDDYVQLKAKVLPVDATNKSVVWSSSDPAVATVDQSGFVTAVSAGTAEIYAQAGDFVATCNVTVEEPTAATLDYVDEYGINHGKGVQIGETVWAPVNCGYHATDYLWGKLYQWGRKYGQGYAGNLYDIVHYSDGYSFVPIGGYVADVTTPELFEGPVSLQDGQSLNNKNVFFTCPDSQYDWLSPQDGTLWNCGTEESPKKTEYDPCPEGWRVPTYAELEQLQQNHSSWTTDVNGHEGYYFCGINSYSETVPQIFLPAAGYRDPCGSTTCRDALGVYWSSLLSYDWGANLYFPDIEPTMGMSVPAHGYSVRCVQLTD